MKNSIYTLAICTLLIVSCEKTVENFEIKKAGPKLVLLGYAYADSTARLYVTRNLSLDESVKNYPIENATCQVYENTSFIGSLLYSESTWYKSDTIKYAEGNSYSFEVSAPGYETVTGNFYIPEKPDIVAIDTHSVIEHSTDCIGCSPTKYLYFDIDFSNNAHKDEYYMVQLESVPYYYYVGDYSETEQTYVYTDSILTRSYIEMTSNNKFIECEMLDEDTYNNLVNENETANGYKFIFSNKELTNGINRLTFKINASYVYYRQSEADSTCSAKLTFKAIDKNMFEYLLSKGRNYRAEGNPFVEPVTIFSNIENGLGLVAGFSEYVQTFDLSAYSNLNNQFYYSH